jgi:methionyl-tRNA synthetase
MKKKILITAALPYANGLLHFGHLAGAYLPADIYARAMRLGGNEVLFISGSDEYGIAVSLAAELAKRTPQEHVDIFHAANKKLFEKLEISFDNYSRTTWKRHPEAVVEYFKDLLANGYVEESEVEQLYSEKDGRFLADRYVVGVCPRCGFEAARGDECTKCAASFEATDLKNPRSKLTGAPLTLRKTNHWYLRLDLFRDKLMAWLATRNWKPNVVNFVKSYIKDVRPRAITRDTSWGIPVPLEGAAGKVLYVWFDAPIGYISATKEWAEKSGKPDTWREWWCDESVKLVQFIGKDNIPFHAVIFPAMTMGQNKPYKLVDELPANEFYNLEGRQFSKSDNWYIDIEDFLSRYSADQIRYTIAANAPENQDSEFTWKEFQGRCNSDLVGKFGNFINRTLVFIQNNLGGVTPTRGQFDEVDAQFLTDLHALAARASDCYATFSVRRAASTLMEMAALGNVYFDQKKPWIMAKEPEARAQMETMLSLCLECAKMLALVASPIMPEAAEKIWKMLGLSGRVSEHIWDKVLAIPYDEMKLSKPTPLFRKIEDEEIEKEIQKLKGREEKKEMSPLISIDDVRKVELKVVQILSAAPIPKSKKLLRLEVDTGSDKRVIVAGIALAFRPEELVGKRVVVVTNLERATLMGVQSEGMVLVASSGDTMKLLEVADLPPGATIS